MTNPTESFVSNAPVDEIPSISAGSVAQALTPEEAKLLINLCQKGKLYEIERWISSPKSLRVPAEFKRTPLQIALDQGFHSLVELLAHSDVGQEAKNEALAAPFRNGISNLYSFFWRAAPNLPRFLFLMSC
ncbi:MAG: hypothetical protein ABR953_06875 [Candidatus Acidiferrales bacterium]|jgi:hypothetical protein